MKVGYTSREVIESKILTALYEDKVVAALLSAKDLDSIIDALQDTAEHKNLELYSGLHLLRVKAFGVRQ